MSRFHALLSFTGLSLLFVLVATLFLHFSWNMVAPDIFGAGEMSFKNALGLVVFLVTVAALVGHSAVTHRSRVFSHSAQSRESVQS